MKGSQKAARRSALEQTVAPRSLPHLLWMLVTGIVKDIPKKLLVKILLLVGVWFFNVYIVMFVNDGFYKGSAALNRLVVQPYHVISGTLFWTFCGMLLAYVWTWIDQKKVGRLLNGVVEAPGYVLHSFQRSGVASASYLLLAGGLALLAANWVANPLVSLQLILFALGALLEREEGFLATVLRLGWSDLHRLFRRGRAVTPASLAGLGVAFVGMGLGWGASMLLPGAIGRIAAISMLVLGVIVPFVRLRRPGAAAALVLVTLLAIGVWPALADDGGWSESGRNLNNWLRNPGTIPFLKLSLVPAFGSVLGVLLGSVLAGLPTSLAGPAASAAAAAAPAIVAGSGAVAGNPPGAAPAPEPKRIYGTGARDDPYRDYPDASKPPYPSYGTGTRDDPYRDYPGAYSSPTEPGALDGSSPGQSGDGMSPQAPTPASGPATTAPGPFGAGSLPFGSENTWAPIDPKVQEWIDINPVWKGTWKVSPDGTYVYPSDFPTYKLPVDLINGKSTDPNADIFTTAWPDADHKKMANDTAGQVPPGDLDNLTKAAWTKLSDGDKLKVLQDVADAAAKNLGLGPTQVVYDPTMKDHAHYDPDTGEIHINPTKPHFASPQWVVGAIGHEAKHKQQWDPKNPMENAGARSIATKNVKDYRHPDYDPGGYGGQYVEKDSDSYGQKVGNKVSKNAYNKKLDKLISILFPDYKK